MCFSDAVDDEKVLERSRKEAEKILVEVPKGSRKKAYGTFMNFCEGKTFDIVGTHVDVNDGRISLLGFGELEAAMKIYRNKNFETFRYILYSPEDRCVREQVAVTSRLPADCTADVTDNLISRAVLNKCRNDGLRVILFHNHPSGSVRPSEDDDKTTRELSGVFKVGNESVLDGHVILDHDTFSFYDCRTGKWSEIDSFDRGRPDGLSWRNYDGLKDAECYGEETLIEVSRKVNDRYKWSDDFIPFVFTDLEGLVRQVSFYDKDFVRGNVSDVKKDFFGSAKSCGALACYAVIPENIDVYGNGIDGVEDVFSNLMRNDVIVDGCIGMKGFMPLTFSQMGHPLGRDYRSQKEFSNGKITMESTFDFDAELDERMRNLDMKEAKVSEGERRLGMKRSLYDTFRSSFLSYVDKSGKKGEAIVTNMMMGLDEGQRRSVMGKVGELAEGERLRKREEKKENARFSVNVNFNEKTRSRGR